MNRVKLLWPLLLLIGVYIAVRSRYWNVQPIWDGAWYSQGLLYANQAPFDLLKFSVDEHICEGFFLVMSLLQHWFRRDLHFFNVWLTVFGTLGLVAFYKVLALLSNGRARNYELALGAALMAFHPSVLASMIHFTLDIGVLVFFLWYWLWLLEERTVAAAIAGVLLVLSKETAVVLPPLLLMFCILRQPPEHRGAWLRRHWLAAVLPYCAFAAMAAYKWARGHPLFWVYYGDSSPLETLRHALTPDVMLANFAGMVFLLNFNWVIFLLWVGMFTFLLYNRRNADVASGLNTAALIGLVFVGAVACAFLVRPFTNVRYVLVPIVLMLLITVYLLFATVKPRAGRLTVLLPLLALLGVEDAHTVDPVSKAFFGTFNFGSHEILSVSRRGWESGNLGRDQLVYNLQFLKFAQLTRRVIEDVRPTADTFILCCPAANWHLLPRLDEVTHEPAFSIKHWFVPHYTDESPDPVFHGFHIGGRAYALSDLPKSLYYIEYPNVENGDQIKALSSRYPHATNTVYDMEGYQVTLVYFSE